METKEPHSLSLKVLRLSKPSLAQQNPLPKQINSGLSVDFRASLSAPLSALEDDFALAPLVLLPPTFGSAYVGEQFSCTLCMNNDLAVSNMTKTVSSVSITAEIQTPSQTIPLDLYPKDETRSRPSLKPAETMQKSLKFDLREEGNHCLAVSLSYSETSAAEGDNRASSGKVRSFRKLYTFVARPCLAVRTKTSEIQMRDSGTDAGQSRYVLEAQVENLAEGLITLDNLTFDPQDAFQSFSINWGLLHGDQKHPDLPVLAPREVTQVVFLIEEAQGSTISAQVPVRQKQPTRDGRTILGSMGIRWRNTMGDLGTLSTGLLTTRRQ